MEQQQLGEARVGTNPRRQIPYDYSFVYQLADLDDPSKSFVNATQSQTVTVSIEAPFTAVSISYALLVPDSDIRFGPGDMSDLERIPDGGDVLGLSAVRPPLSPAIALTDPVPPIAPRSLFFGEVIRSLARKLDEQVPQGRSDIGPKTAQILASGIRLSPELARRFLLSDGAERLDAEDLDELFQPAGMVPERIQFLYALHDEGTGRAFQSEPIFNLAGLGIANGDRPFRYFAAPITFMPRTTIRLDVTPKSEFHGELHVVLHGYKVLGTPGTPTGRAVKRRQLSRRT